jgi:hypothetical protein
MATDGNLLHRLGEYVVEHRRGMVGDLVFALFWVTLVNAFFRLVEGPDWAYYLFMFAGVIAYFGFVFSAQAALEVETGASE